MIDVTTVKLPTYFEETEPLSDDSRFQKVKIYIAHTGENLNHSVFSKDVLTSMIPTLAHIPILGFVGQNKQDETDFRGHEKTLSIDDDGFKVRFNTHAYGFVPEENNAHFEVTSGKEWLVTDGYLWTRFIDAMQIFGESNGSKGQSMEIGNAEGYTDEHGRMVFTQATFTGLCILGDDVPPAMTGSTVSTVFSREDFKSTFEQMLAEFTAEKGEGALATKKKQKDEETVTDSVKEKPEAEKTKEETRANSESAKTEKEEKATDEAKDSKDQSTGASDADKGDDKSEENPDEESDSAEMSKSKSEKDLDKNESANNNDDDFKKDDSEDDNSDNNDAEDGDDEEQDKDKKSQFTLNLTDRQNAVSQAVRAKYETTELDTYPVEVFDDFGYFRFTDWNNPDHIYKITYSLNADDSIKLGEKTEVFLMYLTAEEKQKIEENRDTITTLEAQIAKLTEYKNGIEMSQKEEALENASEGLTSQQMQDIRAQFDTKTPQEIEKEIAFALYTGNKDAVFTSRRVGVQATNFDNKEDYGYGSANDLFHK